MSNRKNMQSAAPPDAIDREGNLPSLTALRAFVSASNNRSFSRAAEELGITQGGVSRAVRSIEEATGTQLFERTGHGLVLTESGAAYLEEVSSILSELAAATLRLSTYNRTSETLNIATLPSLGGRWLAPRLVRFLKQNPTIEISVTGRNGQFDFEGSAIDAAIHYGSEAWPGSMSERIMDEVLVPMCSPALLKSGTPADARLLVDLTLIQHLHRPTAWREWFKDVGIDHPHPNTGPRFEQYQMGIEAANSGLGAILMPPFMVMEELQSGRLVPLHKVAIPSPWRYYLVYPKSKRSKPAVQKLRTWLRGEARRTEEQTLQLLLPGNAPAHK
ncbi:LysR family transcriptional regulator [Rhizobium esperanzae]|uniref:HTH-type transcriptional regulator TtuA n=1 Tax=Rhizobium esperanzae TaxID=1967781 RepID=A0A7W6R171_9HYPH|nr:LysR family transcriptional regulator [Rhizobium esperanzae]MBB4234741.1 DNA-binding transcriptional LysR family regulator [Rhizobium esperanzae]